MELYAEVVGDHGSRDDYLRIAAHFKKKVDHFRAGQFYHKAGEYKKVRCMEVMLKKDFVACIILQGHPKCTVSCLLYYFTSRQTLFFFSKYC